MSPRSEEPRSLAQPPLQLLDLAVQLHLPVELGLFPDLGLEALDTRVQCTAGGQALPPPATQRGVCLQPVGAAQLRAGQGDEAVGQGGVESVEVDMRQVGEAKAREECLLHRGRVGQVDPVRRQKVVGEDGALLGLTEPLLRYAQKTVMS